MEVPTVLSPTRIALQIAENAFLSGLWNSPFSFLLRNALLSGLRSSSLTLLLVGALHRVRPHLLVLQMRILLGFFALFPWEKSARAAASPIAELPREVSSWTPAAYVAPSGSDEWVELYDDVKSKTFYWNRRTRLSSWLPPEGIKVVWVGTMDEEGDYYYWHRETRASTYVLPPLPPE